MSTSSTFNKDLILEATQGGLMVFDHFLTGRGGYAPERSFRNPFYDDKKASCHLYQDKASGNFRFIDFGDNDYHFDCFGFVGHMFNLNCKDSKDFIEILRSGETEIRTKLLQNTHHQLLKWVTLHWG